MENPVRDVSRIVLPPASYLHEREKIDRRWPAAQRFIEQQNSTNCSPRARRISASSCRAECTTPPCARWNCWALSDAFGDTKVPLYVLNVTYPLVDEEVRRFCAGKRAVLLIEEGQPDFIEQNLHSILRKADIETRVTAKTCCRWAASIPAAVMIKAS